jgi:hypothetical protein
MHYLTALGLVHDRLQPRGYLEIGVRRGNSLRLAKCDAIAIDPNPEVAFDPSPQQRIITSTSDDFFKSEERPAGFHADFILIDGMHLFEYVLRDFMNCELWSTHTTVVAIDDVFPNTPLEANRVRQSRVWSGDVWKILPCLREYRPDLTLIPIDAKPTGMVLVGGLDPHSKSLKQNYDAIVERYLHPQNADVPEEILAHSGTMQLDDPRVLEFLTLMRRRREEDAAGEQLRARPAEWNEGSIGMERNDQGRDQPPPEHMRRNETVPTGAVEDVVSAKGVEPKGPRRRKGHGWKIQVGRAAFYNVEQQRILPPEVENAPMEVQVIRDAFISRRSVTSDGTPGGSLHVSGAIYDGQGVILPEFLKPVIYGRTREVFQNPDTIDPARVVAGETLIGRYVYLGTLYKHFGRFLLATMARAWYLIGLDPSVRIIAHSDRVQDTSEFSDFIQTTLNSLGIASERVLLATRDLRVEELIVPSPQFWVRLKGSPGFCLAFDRIRSEIMRTGNFANELPEKIYLTRRHHDQIAYANRRSRRSPHKFVVNEEEVEALFASRGFHIVAPERLPFARQIAMIGNASHVAGLAGSALHMILFNSGPGTKLIELTHRQVMAQRIIDEMRGVDAHHIFCVQTHDQDQRPSLDVAVIERALDEIL